MVNREGNRNLMLFLGFPFYEWQMITKLLLMISLGFVELSPLDLEL